MKKALLYKTALFFLLCAVVSPPVLAQRIDQLPSPRGAGAETLAPVSLKGQKQTLIAVVNDAAISSFDLRSRLALALLSAGLPASPETERQLVPQVLRALIDEQLQLQESGRLGIVVSEAEIQEAMGRVAQDNRIPGGDMEAFLVRHGVPFSALKGQVRAALSWNKAVMRELRPRVDIGDDEVEAALARLRASAGKQEYLLSEIFLAVDKPEDEEAARSLAEKLVEQIKGGAVFGAAARQFSQGLGAASGGDLGWIQVGQLAGEIDALLPTLEPGAVVGPVRTAEGFHILGLRDKRIVALGAIKDMTVRLEQIFHPFTSQAGKDALLAEAAHLRGAVASCETLKPTLAAHFPTWRWQDLGEVKLDQAPSWLAEKVVSLPEGQASEPLATDKGALILFVCGRTMPDAVSRDALRATIGTEKLDLLARRHMRDLRKAAFIDVRLP